MTQKWLKKRLDEGETRIVLEQYADLVENFMSMKNGSLVAFYTRLAEKLSMAINRSEPWSWRYAQGVHRGTILPSREFARAVSILLAEFDGLPSQVGRLEQVAVYTEPGRVQHGAIVMGRSRVCARVGCNRIFVPNVPWRRVCPICKPPKPTI